LIEVMMMKMQTIQFALLSTPIQMKSMTVIDNLRNILHRESPDSVYHENLLALFTSSPTHLPSRQGIGPASHEHRDPKKLHRPTRDDVRNRSSVGLDLVAWDFRPGTASQPGSRA
jgi:hypothetical protein